MSSNVGGDDVISNLADPVICHILSFLLIKQAAASSILSKRWIHLWRSVPVINFKGEESIELGDEEVFNDVVYSILLSRGSNSIESFSLKIHYGNHDLGNLGFPSVLLWINYVVQHNVESIDIHVDIENNFFPNCLYNTMLSPLIYMWT
ncbi:unnamed protein product [Lathyrus sativus]|nr:unnamed protein product [Lathyrus sativus]